MEQKKVNLETAQKAWENARQMTIDAMSALAKENEGNIISFDDIDTFTKLRYTKEKGVELFRARGCQRWVSINADATDFLSDAPDNQALQYILDCFIHHDYDVHTPAQDGKRIKKSTGVGNEYKYVDYEPKEFAHPYIPEECNKLRKLFLDIVKEHNIEKTIDPEDGNSYKYKVDFPKGVKLPFTYKGTFLTDDTVIGINVTTWKYSNGEPGCLVWFISDGEDLIEVSHINSTHIKQIANSVRNFLK